MQQVLNLLQHLKSLYPASEDLSCQNLALDNPWYIVASVAFSASNRPDLVAEVYKLVSKELSSQDDHELLVKRLRDALFKATVTIGLPKAINALVALSNVTPKAISKKIGTLARDASISLADYSLSGQQNFKKLYGEASGPVQNLLDAAYPDLCWYTQTLTYGIVLGQYSVISQIETSYAMIASIIPLDTPKQINWHLAGARRQGASLEEVKAVRQIAIEAAAFSGVTWREGVPEVTESISEQSVQ